MEKNKHPYDVVIIGGGASGTALLYTLANYTDLGNVALVEKYDQVGMVNSNAVNNSQTLHVGDIETNYSVDKARQVRPASMMVARYVERLPADERQVVMTQVQKMILAVGKSEVAELEDRYSKIGEIFPTLQRLDAAGIAAVEPEVMKGRPSDEPVLAAFDPKGYSVNFGELSKSFIKNSSHVSGKRVDVFLGMPVVSLEKKDSGYVVHTKQGDLFAKVVVVDTDAYSLGFAKSLGYGKEFSLIPIAGSFYFTNEVLKGKVYTMQDSRMPFAAAHGDPDLTMAGKTRFGPTARFFPVLESRNLKTMADFFKSSGLGRWKTWKSFFKILLEPVRFRYLGKNLLYELPYVGKYLFVHEVQKIVPTIRGGDLTRADSYGGMRLQRVDTNTGELLLGEGKILGDHIIFNMTPSPGASVCLYNAMRDAETVVGFFDGTFSFDKDRMHADLIDESQCPTSDVSAKTYVS